MTPAEVYHQLGAEARAELARALRRDDAALRYSFLPQAGRRIKSFNDFRQSAKRGDSDEWSVASNGKTIKRFLQRQGVQLP